MANFGSGIFITCDDIRNERTSLILRSQGEFAFKKTICSQLSYSKEIEKPSDNLCSIQVGGNCKDPICYSQFNCKVELLACPLEGWTELLHLGKCSSFSILVFSQGRVKL